MLKTLFFIVILNSFLFANNEYVRSDGQTADSSKPYLYISTGFYEAACIGFGKDFDESWGIGIKANIFVFNTNVLNNNGAALGLRLHKRIFRERRIRVFDTISFEASLGSTFITAYHPAHNICNEFQINVSSEKENRHGLHLFYSAGVGYSYEKSSGGMLTPIFKLGTIYNF